jgi:hypothetical protein
MSNPKHICSRILILLIILAATHQSTLSIDNKLNIVFFISPTCPISQIKTFDVNNIVINRKINTIGVIPKNMISSRKEIRKYKRNYKPEFKIKYDRKNTYYNIFRPIVVPEVFLIRENIILYSGAIDNEYEDIGKKNKITDKLYLEEAINGSMTNTIFQKRIEPVGCIIQ